MPEKRMEELVNLVHNPITTKNYVPDDVRGASPGWRADNIVVFNKNVSKNPLSNGAMKAKGPHK